MKKVKQVKQVKQTQHPMQPVLLDGDGRPRFKENPIVSRLLNFATSRGMGMNEIAMMRFSREDREHFAQLIGYSVSGYGELSYVRDSAFEAAAMIALKLSPKTKPKKEKS